MELPSQWQYNGCYYNFIFIDQKSLLFVKLLFSWMVTKLPKQIFNMAAQWYVLFYSINQCILKTIHRS